MNTLLIKKYIPWPIKLFLRRLRHGGNAIFCNCCQSGIKQFIPGGSNNEAINKYQIIGAGYFDNDICPLCHSGYRQRLIIIYLNQNQLLSGAINLLHLAPEQHLYFTFSAKKNITYVYGDLEPERYTYYCANPIKTDLTNLQFQDASFDLVIASHILEHIPDDRKAMAELFRVLKPGGRAIVQVPISWTLEKTFEDPTIVSEQDRTN